MRTVKTKTEKEQKDEILISQRWEAIKNFVGGDSRIVEFFGKPDARAVKERWIIDLMEYAISSQRLRELPYRDFLRHLRAFEKIEVFASTPHLSNREKKLKEIYGKYARGIPYRDLLDEYGNDLVESMCELYNLVKM